MVNPTIENDNAYKAFSGEAFKRFWKKVVVQLFIKPSIPLSKKRKKLVNNSTGSFKILFLLSAGGPVPV